ncbi:hypothetical protein NBRC110019_08930 [Neptunitalea chrysea]|uniref:DUF1697 domain-containing protein n=1 Tax=Neptunitalea chrysea TaxID=1647581 RepID=A0A9W6B5V7_9FLAO|nr:DUF1697 domain-containing protein [Neptunitalea chrysea]GLB51854.1 hypothetical protein NBRC110019_08930 [Neptunitalea chrysea]
MPTYICLLRSINVSGTNIIKMADLKLFWTSLGFKNVATYIQSGNIIFESDTTPNASELEQKIEEKFSTKNVSVIIKTPYEMETILTNNPYTNLSDFDLKKMYVCYLQNIPASKEIETFLDMNFGTDKFTVTNDVVYIYYRESAGKSKLTNKVIEKALQTASTARNWNTTNKIVQLSK